MVFNFHSHHTVIGHAFSFLVLLALGMGCLVLWWGCMVLVLVFSALAMYFYTSPVPS